MVTLSVRYLKNINIKILSYCTVLTLLFFGINYGIEYATDTYATFGERGTWEWMLYENGRLFNAFIYYLFEYFHIPAGYTYKLSFMAALFFSAGSSYLLGEVLYGELRQELTVSLTAFLTVLNFYVLEYFLFIEKGLFLLAVFLCVAAFRLTVCYFEKRSFIYPVFSLLLLLWAVFIYQAVLGLYVLLCLPFIVKYAKDIRQFLTYNIMTALLYGIPILAGYLITNIFLQSSRVSTPSLHISRITEVLATVFNISTKQWVHVPAYVYPCFLFLCMIFFFLTGRKTERRAFLKRAGIFCYLIAACLVVSFFFHFAGVSSSYLPRLIYPYGCLFGVILISSFLLKDGKRKQEDILCNRYLKYYLTTLLFLMAGVQYLSFQSVFIDRYRCNQADYYYSQILAYQIEEYEGKNNVTVDTICFYNDQNVLWWERGYDESNLNTRAQSCGWSNLTAINLYMGKEYTKGEPLQKYIDHFKQYDWGTYTEEQLIFEGNTLHLCIY